MKRLILTSLISSFPIFSASAAGVFYSFDTEMDGTGVFDGDQVAKTVDATANDGFGAVSMSYTGTVHPTGMAGGAASFTAFDGTTWDGSGGTGTPGRSLGFNPSSTGNSFSMTFSTLSLSNLALRMNIRAGASSGSNIGGFSSFTYSINGGAPVNVGADLSFTTATSFQVWTADLSALTGGAIDDNSEVTLNWTIGDLSSARSLRVDNLQITAVPEPSGGLLAGLAASTLLVRRRRK
ncbi:PEP-CTERM sorting domain-containing protein [Luteolibacter sp. SL250]|uniref:PEP-CTERM sorting domain-containing protein n=1 Tax=Luteolibacter sp. SL250 TaxID=2995170 RepID=UPI002270AF60|nr:PEP-CTERM sorting domain-containing protein [Luteolibacter sp. SL250]WAC20784.1 PEP-CTERM sorting domain-containing protein [Luteolibacter sp. SL250]